MIICIILFLVSVICWIYIWISDVEDNAGLYLNEVKIRHYLLQERIRNMDRKPITISWKMDNNKKGE